MTVPADDITEPTDAPEAPVTDVADAPAPAAEEELDPFAPNEAGEPATFPREYVEKLRREGAKYRTTAKEREAELERLRPYEEAFAGFEPEQVEGWRQFLTAAREDPEGALGALMRDGYALDRGTAIELLDSIFEEAGEQAPVADSQPPAEGDPLDRPLTLRELEAREQAKAAEAAQAAAVAQVKDEAKGLGYNPTADPGSLDEFRYHRLLHLAATKFGNDLAQAHEALVAEEQAATQERLASLASTADELPVPSGTGGSGAPVGGEADWDQTRSRAREYLAAARTVNP